MRIDDLKYLVHVAETESISKSAECLFMSQQGISHAIKSLEKELGGPLFRRSTNSIVITGEGVKAVEKAKEILFIYEEMLTLFDSNQDHKSGTTQELQELNILFSSIYSLAVLKNVLAEFSRRYPQVNVNIIEQPSAEITCNILNIKNSIGIICLRKYLLERWIDSKKKPKHVEILLEYEVFASVANTSPLAIKKVLTTKELIKYPIIAYNTAQQIRIINELFQDVGKPNIKIITSDLDLYLTIINSGQCIGISNGLPLKYQRQNFYKNIPIQDKSAFNFVFASITPPEQVNPTYVDDFRNMINGNLLKEYSLN